MRNITPSSGKGTRTVIGNYESAIQLEIKKLDLFLITDR